MKLLGTVMAAALLVGCATTYQSSGLSGGFSEMQMAQDVYRIKFKGNAFTSSEAAQEMAMLRAAELTMQSGYSHFIVMGAQDGTDRSYIHQPGTTTTTITPTGFNSYQATSSTYGGYTAPIDKPRTELMIRMVGPGQGGLDAQMIYRQLAAKYKGGS